MDLTHPKHVTDLTILYRGPLSSCNYGCAYCPFAKHFESPEELAHDKAALLRFAAWCEATPGGRLSVFFTPWGEALVRRWYQHAVAFLTQLPHVRRVAVQTNLSCPLDWLDQCDVPKLGIWATYHPTETTREKFVAKVRALAARGVRHSAGVVGMREHLADARKLREELPADTYLWVNAYKRDPAYYDADLLAAFERLDPHFPTNTVNHPSRGNPCNGGETVVAVDGDGTIRRCHFIKTPIGNLYDPDWHTALRPRPCTNETCGCHIGYVHMPRLGLGQVYGDGILERVPIEWQPLKPDERSAGGVRGAGLGYNGRS